MSNKLSLIISELLLPNDSTMNFSAFTLLVVFAAVAVATGAIPQKQHEMPLEMLREMSAEMQSATQPGAMQPGAMQPGEMEGAETKRWGYYPYYYSHYGYYPRYFYPYHYYW